MGAGFVLGGNLKIQYSESSRRTQFVELETKDSERQFYWVIQRPSRFNRGHSLTLLKKEENFLSPVSFLPFSFSPSDLGLNTVFSLLSKRKILVPVPTTYNISTKNVKYV